MEELSLSDVTVSLLSPVFWIGAVHGQNVMYPFGEEYDDHLGTPSLDGCDAVTLSHSFSFYGNDYYELYVRTLLFFIKHTSNVLGMLYLLPIVYSVFDLLVTNTKLLLMYYSFCFSFYSFNILLCHSYFWHTPAVYVNL